MEFNANLENESYFQEIARERSLDPFSAPKGGDLGFMPIGKDTEFDDFFATMDLDEIRYFRSLEGHVILWLRGRQERRAAAFDEIKDKVRKDLTPWYRDQILADWVVAKRKELGVKVYEDRLLALELGP